MLRLVKGYFKWMGRIRSRGICPVTMTVGLPCRTKTIVARSLPTVRALYTNNLTFPVFSIGFEIDEIVSIYQGLGFSECRNDEFSKVDF